MSDRPLSDDVRALQVIWLAIVGGAVLAVAVLWWVAGRSANAAPMAESADVLFMLNALASAGAIVVGFALQRMIPARVMSRDTEEAAFGQVRALGIASVAVMEASALTAGVAAFLTGNALNLAFVLPFLAFAALFFPSGARVASLMRR
ncbi:MAG: hypothetical protein AAFR95_04645 [Bacteroidota bacterium]